MTVDGTPRGVRVIVLLAWSMVPAGALLVLAGALDLVWWASPGAGRLTTLMDGLRAEYGVHPPAMLRHGSGAVTLLVLGAAGMAYALLAPAIRRGRRWARSWALGVAFAMFLITLMGIGADASQPTYLRDYYAVLQWTGLGDRIPEVRSLIYPGWYSWLEDVAQGVAAAVALAVVVGLAWAAAAHPDHFVGSARAGAPAEPDEWDAALAKVRERRER